MDNSRNSISVNPDSSRAGNHRSDVAYWIVLAVACALFLVMNLLTTLKEDDMSYTLVDSQWTPIRSLADVLRSIYNHYWSTNGRFADVLAIIFSGALGKMAFNVCNTLVLGVLAHLLSVLATGRRSVLALAGFFTVVGTCYPAPGETMLWLAGSLNYMWAITASLLLVYYLTRRCDGSTMGWGRGVLLFLGAAVAGSFNEATSVGFLVGLCAFYACNRKRLTPAVVVALVGYLLGTVFVLSSPGLWLRASAGGVAVDMAPDRLLSSRCFIFVEKMLRFITPVAALVVCVAALLFRQGRQALRQSVWPYVLVTLALFMFALGLVQERAYAPLATVAFLIVIAAAEWLLSRWPVLRIAAIVAALALTLFTWGRGIKILKDYKAYDDQTTQEIIDAPSQAILHERQFPVYSRFIKPMNYISGNFFAHEVIYRAYYNKENVQFVNDSVYERYHSGRLLENAVRLPLVSDRPGVVDSVMAIPGQTYMAVVLHTDTLPVSMQTAKYYIQQNGRTMSAHERERRENYGLVTDYNPQGFYPLRYQGRSLLIFPLVDSHTSRVVFPVELGLDAAEASLSR